MASLWCIRVANIASLESWGHFSVKSGSLEHKHHGTTIVHLIT